MATRKRQKAHEATSLGEKRLIGALKPHPANYRRHGPVQLGVLRESLRVHGQQKPVVITPDGTILAGHGLVEAAKLEGWETIACHVYDGPYPEAFLAMDNRASDLAEDDSAALAALLTELREKEQLGAAGYDDGALDALLAELKRLEPAREEGPVPEPQEGPTRVQVGEVWALGRHRIICGDSTDPAIVGLLMGEYRAALMATDPPYGCNAGNIGFTAERDDIEAITKDDLEGVEMQAFLEKAFVAAIPHLLPNAAWYLWHPMLTQGYFAAAAAAAAADLIIHRPIIWRKEQFIFGRGDYHWRHELCFYGWRKGNRPPWYGERNQDTVWDIPWGEKRGDVGHPTAKPPELFAIPLRNHLRAGEVCYEPFCGSGSQIIAAEQCGVRCFAVEIEPRYAELSMERWSRLTGQQPISEATGLTLAQIPLGGACND